VGLQWVWVTSILKCVVCYRWRFLWLDIYFRFFSSLIIWYLLCLKNVNIWFVPIPSWSAFIGGFFICYDMSLSILCHFLSLCWVLCFIDDSRFPSFKSKVKILGKDFSMMYYTIGIPMTMNYFILWFSIIHYYLFQCQNSFKLIYISWTWKDAC